MKRAVMGCAVALMTSVGALSAQEEPHMPVFSDLPAAELTLLGGGG